MKSIAIVKYVFALIGAGMLIGAFFLAIKTNSFMNQAAKAEGTVVDLVSSRSSNSTVYRPSVSFVDRNGQEIQFVSSGGTNPPSYSIGEKVEVFYRPTDSQDAKINGFFSLWGGSVILGVLGGIFFLVGGGIMLVGSLQNRKEEFLRNNGMPIDTEYQSVEQNTALSANGRHPFRVVTQWRNPLTAELHIFRSNNLWFDPSGHIGSRKITVFIERNNPKKYVVDLSFLPELAE